MKTYLSVAQIIDLFKDCGASLYGGETVTQTEHALQSAWFAEKFGGDDFLVIACLLHDLGHMLSEQGNDDLANGKDDAHQLAVLPFLRGLMPAEVTEPIRLHVDAKRYLCHVEAGYFASLSEASRLSLALQGGVMSSAAATTFLAETYAERAIALRRCDDAAKVHGLKVHPLAYYLPRLIAIAERTASV